MYHAIVQKIVRSTWRKVNAGDLDAPWRLAADDLHPRRFDDYALDRARRFD